jgi:methyl-accepting chemotaxis protein
VLIARATRRELAGLTAELNDGARQVATASEEVATSSQTLSQGATEQAASLEEASASMEEMASMTRQNAENSQSAAVLMTEVDAQVRASNETLAGMVTSMAAIQESSQQVGRIIKTIDEIAFQTNLLALNAAVEAARAGAAGMGFAVVADEVRTLAQRSAEAARGTAVLIEESIARAELGSTKLSQVGEAITAITAHAQDVKGLVDGMSIAARQQTDGIEQVRSALTSMEQTSQRTAALAEEAAAASEELAAQSEVARHSAQSLAQLAGASNNTGVEAVSQGDAEEAMPLRRAA